MIKFVFVLTFLIISTSTLPLSEIKDNKNVKESIIKLHLNDTDNSKTKRDTINYQIFIIERNRIIYTFSKNTFEKIKEFYDECVGKPQSKRKFNKQMKKIYWSNYTSRDWTFDVNDAYALSNVFYTKFKFIREDIDKTNSTWFTIDTEVSPSFPNKNVDEWDFYLYRTDTDGQLDQTVVQKIINKVIVEPVKNLVSIYRESGSPQPQEYLRPY